MRFSLDWLKMHLDTNASTQELADKMVALGIEVEEILDESTRFKNVVIGHVISREKHPNADKLGVCMVDVGENRPLQIVCGAPNVREGLKVAVALPGACLPGDFKIKNSKIRGVESWGMICSSRELEIGDDHTGIMELETNAKNGELFAHVYGYDDIIFDVSITPNRGDTLSVYGIARDLAASGIGQLKTLPDYPLGKFHPRIIAEVRTEDCHYFSGIEIMDVKNTTSPKWIQKLLISAGLNPINAIVDVTNFINLDLGQPLHAYDANKLGDTLTITNVLHHEKYKALDEKEYIAQAGDIGIFDDDELISLAGIMGGETTAVDEKTVSVYLEAAWFDRSRIARTGQAHNIISESRHRFERGIDPEMIPIAAAKAATLIQEICGGSISAMQSVGTNKKQVKTISFNPNKVLNFGGLNLCQEESTAILEVLGFSIKIDGHKLLVTPPSYRTYMETEEDLVEEILRLAGYDTVPEVIPPLPSIIPKNMAPMLNIERTARRELAACGYLETLTYSFISENAAIKFSNETPSLVKLTNPIDEENMSTLRPSLLPGLLKVAVANIARSENSVRIAEVGKHYSREDEILWASGISIGNNISRHWRDGSKASDVFDAKSDALAILETLGMQADKLQVRTGAPKWYHPNKSGCIQLGKNVYAYFGELHPNTVKTSGLKGVVTAFEINLEAVNAIQMKSGNYTTSTYQPVTKDMAFIVDSSVTAGDMLSCIKGADKKLIKQVNLFDIYEGDKLSEGKKSLAFSITLQATDKTLSDDDITGVMNSITNNATKHFGAVLRDK